jgi:hypothetical protein
MVLLRCDKSLSSIADMMQMFLKITYMLRVRITTAARRKSVELFQTVSEAVEVLESDGLAVESGSSPALWTSDCMAVWRCGDYWQRQTVALRPLHVNNAFGIRCA